VTASFGVASTGRSGPDLGIDADSLIGVADDCLYRSKRGGRNQVASLELTGDRCMRAAELIDGSFWGEQI
jgi:hypothetical protein